jgi:glycosyltransferase involved in cell wall biosynthesis
MFMPVFITIKNFRFDIAHNLNFHTDWIPTFLWIFRKPVVWGPIGHHPKIPNTYYHSKNTSLIDRLKNQVIWFVKKTFWTLDPFFHLAKRNVDSILCFSQEVAKQMKANPKKVEYMYSVGSEKNSYVKSIKKNFKVLSVGRLVPLKSFDITIRSFHLFLNNLTFEEKENVELVIIGKGIKHQELVNYIKRHMLENYIKIIDWMERDDLKKHYKSSSLFFFPSHEGAGMVVPEAFSYGVPTLCFDNNGPGVFVNESCGVKIPYSNYNDSVKKFSKKLNYLFRNREITEHLADGARKEFTKSFLWDHKAEKFNSIYENILREKRYVTKNQLIS